MRKFLILTDSSTVKRVEFEYLWYWTIPYECVDATFVNLSSSRSSALEEFKRFVYKIWYLNPGMDCDSLIDVSLSTLESTLKTKGVYLMESDVYRIVYDITKEPFPHNINDIVKMKKVGYKDEEGVWKSKEVLNTKRIEWKKDLRGLFELSDEDKIIYENNPKLAKEYYKKIKREYAMKCINKCVKDGNYEKVNVAMELLREDSFNYGIKEIAEVSGLSYPTVKTYVDRIVENINGVNGYNVVVNKVSKSIEENMELMRIAIETMNNVNAKVTKSGIHKETGISRTTIDKYWDELKVYIK